MTQKTQGAKRIAAQSKMPTRRVARPVYTHPEKPPQLPEGRPILARVRPADAQAIQGMAEEYDLPIEAVAAAVAKAGESLLRDNLTRGNDAASVATGRTATFRLWRVINRDPAYFSGSVPVLFGDEIRFQLSYDAWAMRRDPEDWVGTLIREGMDVFSNPKALAIHAQESGLKELIFKAATRDVWAAVSKKGGAR